VQKALGIADPDSSENRSLKNVLTRAVGLDKHIDIFLDSIRPKAGDILMICSDGLTKNASQQNVYAILSDISLSVSRKADALVEEANLGGGDDNISVILLEVLENSKPGTFTKIFNPRA
jgi:protein phosphatase